LKKLLLIFQVLVARYEDIVAFFLD
jgi:hypothetical protein